jgi:FkbM family methyltransferase
LRIFSVHEARGRRAGTNQPLDDVAREARAQEEILIKIDMQGYEEKVLLGGVDLIARARLLTIEVSFKTLYEREVLF